MPTKKLSGSTVGKKSKSASSKNAKSTGSTVRKKTKSAGLSIREMGETLARIEAQTSQTNAIVLLLGRLRFLPSGVSLTNAVQQILEKVQKLH